MPRFVAALLLLIPLLCTGCLPLMKATMSFYQGNYQEAIPVFEERVGTSPGDWATRQKLAFAYLKTGKPKEAAEQFERVLAQEPKAAPLSYLYLGSARLALNQPEAALTTLRSYNDRTRPLVKAEVDRLITMVEVEASRKQAKAALGHEAALAATAVKPGSIAVFNYAVRSDEPTYRAFQKALTAMTMADLAQIKTVSVVERARLQALQDEMKLGQSGAVEAATAPRAGRLAGAETLLVGSLDEAKGRLFASSTGASTTRGAILGSFRSEAQRDSFFDLQKQIVAGVIKVCNITVDPESLRAILGAQHTRSFQAAVLFGQGLDAQDRGDWLASKEFFTLAAKEDPNFTLAKDARDRSPGGLTAGLEGTAGEIALRGIETAVQAQTTSDSMGIGKSGGSGGGGGG